MVTNFFDVVSARLDERTSRGLAHAVSQAIGDGWLVEGMKVPPIREVAATLDLSPSTVATAWRLLGEAGALRTDGRRGSVVARRGRGPARYRRALRQGASLALDLSTGMPDEALLPDVHDALSRMGRGWSSGSYLDDPVIDGLADVLRGDWPYEAESFMVVDGAMDALEQISTLVLRYGDRVIVENPSFPPLLDLLDGLGVRLIGVDVDVDGLDLKQLETALTLHPRAVFLQPRAHNPTGVSMDAAHAQEVALRLRESTLLIIEDDSAGAIAVAEPLSVGRWLPASTVHVRSFSKSHGPDLRLAALSAPNALAEQLRERRRVGQGWTSRLLQAVLLDLLTDEGSRGVVARARDTYAVRRGALVDALEHEGVPTMGSDGINIWLPVRDETAALIALASHGIGAAAGAPFATKEGNAAFLRVTAGLVDRDAGQLARVLAQAAREVPMGGPR